MRRTEFRARGGGRVYNGAIQDRQNGNPGYNIWEVPQIANIRFWRRFGGSSTSERGADSDVAHFRAITDQDGRLLVAMTHNTDIQDSWEREGDDPRFFEQFAPDGYSLGVNVLLHVMSQ